MHDDMIKSKVDSFFPEPCADNYPEFNHFVCIGCIGHHSKYAIKAEATKSYIDDIISLKAGQVALGFTD